METDVPGKLRSKGEPVNLTARSVLGNARSPILFRGLVKNWSACESWSPGRLAKIAEEMGDLQVSYRSTPEGMEEVDMQKIRSGKMSLVEFLEECARDPDGPELYIPGLDLPPDVGLREEIGFPEWLSPTQVSGTSLFMGRNTKCIGHFHPRSQALLCQVKGRKKIRMLAPRYAKHASLFPWWSEGFFVSRVNYYAQSPSRELERIPFQEYELDSGDALFIPLHWLHIPEGIGWSATVTHWWPASWREWPVARTSGISMLGIAGEYVRQKVRGGAVRSE